MQESFPELPDNVLLLAESAHLPFGELPVSEHRLKFVGSGDEYFRIWIVNLFLSILTLGIYSAWAKVRREQYFHRNTLLDGSGFDYHGKPEAILKGRAIAVALLIALSVIDQIAPAWHFPVLLLASPLIPWLLIRSFIFRARNTSFRGLHFDFRGAYKGLCRAFLPYILIFLAVGWAMTYSMEEIASRMESEQQVMLEAGDEVAEADTGFMVEGEDEEDEAAFVDDDEEERDARLAEENEEDDALGFAGEEDEDGVATKSGCNKKGVSESETGDKVDFGKLMESMGRIFAILGLGLAAMFILLPAVMGTLKRFQFNNLAFGASGFRLECGLPSFYIAYLRSLLPIFIAAGALFAMTMVFYALLFGSEVSDALKAFGIVSVVMIMMVVMPFYILALIVTPAYLQALLSNLVWNKASLEEHRFVSDQTFWGITGITLSNWLLILLTLGLFWPWAKVRLAAYRASRTAVLVAGSLEHFVAGATLEKNALGEEIADVFDFDIAF